MATNLFKLEILGLMKLSGMDLGLTHHLNGLIG